VPIASASRTHGSVAGTWRPLVVFPQLADERVYLRVDSSRIRRTVSRGPRRDRHRRRAASALFDRARGEGADRHGGHTRQRHVYLWSARRRGCRRKPGSADAELGRGDTSVVRQAQVLLAAAGALLAVCPASDAGAAVQPSHAGGDPRGLALLERVRTAYAAVPAVSVTARIGAHPIRFTLVLRRGVVVAEQLVSGEGAGATLLVAHGSGSTLAREPGSSCWRALPSSDPQALDDLGRRFPELPGMRVGAPHATPTGWALPITGPGGPYTYAVDRGSGLLRSITVRSPGGAPIFEHVSRLRARPTLLTAAPRC
jgi:hypothetical protein